MGNRTRPSNEPWHPTVSSCLQQIWSPTRNFHSSIDQRNRSHPSRLHVSDFVDVSSLRHEPAPFPGKGTNGEYPRCLWKSLLMAQLLENGIHPFFLPTISSLLLIFLRCHFFDSNELRSRVSESSLMVNFSKRKINFSSFSNIFRSLRIIRGVSLIRTIRLSCWKMEGIGRRKVKRKHFLLVSSNVASRCSQRRRNGIFMVTVFLNLL